MEEKELHHEIHFDFFKKIKMRKEKPIWEKVVRGVLWGIIGGSSLFIFSLLLYIYYVFNFW